MAVKVATGKEVEYAWNATKPSFSKSRPLFGIPGYFSQKETIKIEKEKEKEKKRREEDDGVSPNKATMREWFLRWESASACVSLCAIRMLDRWGGAVLLIVLVVANERIYRSKRRCCYQLNHHAPISSSSLFASHFMHSAHPPPSAALLLRRSSAAPLSSRRSYIWPSPRVLVVESSYRGPGVSVREENKYRRYLRGENRSACDGCA